MFRKLESRVVVLLVAAPVAVDDDVTVQPGEYEAIERRYVTKGAQARAPSLTSPLYLMELTGEQLAALGAEQLAEFASVEFDVTKFVRGGQMIVKRHEGEVTV